jgi:hypothetical protein
MSAAISTSQKVAVQWFYESEVLNQSSVLLIKFSAKNRHLRVVAKHQPSHPIRKMNPSLHNSTSRKLQFVNPSTKQYEKS